MLLEHKCEVEAHEGRASWRLAFERSQVLHGDMSRLWFWLDRPGDGKEDRFKRRKKENSEKMLQELIQE